MEMKFTISFPKESIYIPSPKWVLTGQELINDAAQSPQVRTRHGRKTNSFKIIKPDTIFIPSSVTLLSR